VETQWEWEELGELDQLIRAQVAHIQSCLAHIRSLLAHIMKSLTNGSATRNSARLSSTPATAPSFEIASFRGFRIQLVQGQWWGGAGAREWSGSKVR